MPKQDVLDGLMEAIEAAGWKAEPLGEFPTSDVVLKTPCFAVFFGVVKDLRHLEGVHKAAQGEIASASGDASWPRDLELVLLIAGETRPDPAAVRSIVDDRYICRKFILCVNGREIRDVLADLPFWPPDNLLVEIPTSVAARVQEAVKGYDPHLIADFASQRPGAERVFEKIQEGQYSLHVEASAGELVRRTRRAPSTFTRLKALDITDFRGIRRLRPEDMPLGGDVIFVYGPNGVGKTSIADAVEWAITGQVHRLQRAPSPSAKGGLDPIVNVFSENGQARVVCYLSKREPVCRLKNGRSMQRLIGPDRAADDRAVIDYVVGTRAPSPDARLRIEQLRDLFRGSHILSQNNIREFLERTGPSERFDVLTNMIGAEEFVRFRKKVAAVMGHLRSHGARSAEVVKSLKSRLEDASNRLRERQKDLEGLSRAVTAGKTAKHIASQLLQGMRKCECAIDESALERADAEPAGRRFELIAGHAETVIRAKKAETEDLLVRLNSLEQEQQGYVESRTRCNRLAAEIASAKRASEKTHADLREREKARQDIQSRLQVLRTMQSEAARRSGDLAWLKKTLPAYRRDREALQRTENSLTGQRETLQRAEAALEGQQKSVNVNQARLPEIEQAITTNKNKEQALAALLRRLPHVQAERREAEQLGNREKQLASRIRELTQHASLARDAVNDTRVRLDELQRAYNSEAPRHDVLGSFLARLAELVHSAECPLCGRGFATAEEAKESIRDHLSAVPLQLRDLAGRLGEAKREAQTKQAQVDSIAADIRAQEAESETVRSGRGVATQAMQGFLSQCAALSVPVSGEDAVSWQNALEEARKKCAVAPLNLEAARLRDAINVAASDVAEKRNVIDGLQRKLVQDERERTRLVIAAQGPEADMVERGFEPGSLPKDDELAAQLSKAQGEARERAASIVEREAELRAVESASAELRESLRRGQEDVASKEAQLRQYETTCGRFVAACRAVNVDEKSPTESIRAVKRRALELKQSLSGLEEKGRILRQVANLSRLKLEIDDLRRTKSDVKQQAEQSSQEESRLCAWVSRVESLETEVVGRQVDVVGTHLERLEPTTQRLYQRLSPHPIFGKIRIRVDEKTRQLDVEAEASVLRDRLADLAISPPAFFSDAQMNSLAITVFLAGALRQRWSGFNTILIDDPVQQMDEMNVCAFLDLIRGLSTQQQFIVFTCSRDFYLLALDKLACLNKSKEGSFLAYRLEGVAPAELKVHCDTA